MKKGIRFYLALYGAKLFSKGLSLIGRAGTHNPGVLALKICPDFLARMDMPKTIIGITGTNGKTTTANMVIDILTDNGFQPVSNRSGSNILGGVVTTLIGAITLTGHTVRDLAVLELDERSSRLIYPYVHPNLLLVTNLFRDSFKRNAHAEFIYDILDQNIPASTKLVLNGDDLISARLAAKNDRVYFGVDPLENEEIMDNNIIQDLPLCPYCGAPMVYEFRRYHHIGRAHCSHCDFASPALDYALCAVHPETGRVEMRMHEKTEDFKMVGQSAPDLYNLAGAIALLSEFGLTPLQLRSSIEKLHIVESRYHEEEIAGKTVILSVAKGQNPIACSRVFASIRRRPGCKTVILMLDDLGDAKETSENIAWLYDTDYEFLRDDSIVQIICAGVRSLDHRVRLLVAGVAPEKITCVSKESEAADAVRPEETDTIYLLYDVYTVSTAKAAEASLKALLEREEEHQ